MMSDVSKAVVNRVAIARTLLAAVEVQGQEVVSQLEATLFPQGVPEGFDVRVFMDALTGHVQRSIDDLVQKDRAHAIELADDDAPRQERDSAKAALRETLFGIRDTLEGVFGASIAAAYGLSGATPEDSNELLSRAAAVSELLANRPLVEKPLRLGVMVDLKAIASELNVHIGALDKALGDVRREEREAQVTRDARNASLAAWSASYQGVADILTGMLELVGKQALAERVRPTSRRRAGLTEQADMAEVENGAGEGT